MYTYLCTHATSRTSLCRLKERETDRPLFPLRRLRGRGGGKPSFSSGPFFFSSFCASGMLSYCGALTTSYRKELQKVWLHRCVAEGLNVDAHFSLKHVLCSEEEEREFLIQGLPADERSIENAIISMQSVRRWPLFIDPQKQARRWLRSVLLAASSASSRSFFSPARDREKLAFLNKSKELEREAEKKKGILPQKRSPCAAARERLYDGADETSRVCEGERGGGGGGPPQHQQFLKPRSPYATTTALNASCSSSPRQAHYYQKGGRRGREQEAEEEEAERQQRERKRRLIETRVDHASKAFLDQVCSALSLGMPVLAELSEEEETEDFDQALDPLLTRPVSLRVHAYRWGTIQSDRALPSPLLKPRPVLHVQAQIFYGGLARSGRSRSESMHRDRNTPSVCRRRACL